MADALENGRSRVCWVNRLDIVEHAGTRTTSALTEPAAVLSNTARSIGKGRAEQNADDSWPSDAC